ncbi:Uncharacterized conserved protein [Janthinobacterium sp. Marseille]|nr:Rieske 2Fe-2S domain-containing protein [Janthinobacterium sp. Marseille]ABR90364.1 Uncharacterized conserved protein [Janthinobacterium sp. Marseille]
MNNIDTRSWFPLVRSTELPYRHVAHAQLFGYELALWRDDTGAVNVWENRCPHRGLRLTLGTNTGTDLQCRYHGWSFESGDGGCSFVPAHRDDSEPSKACVLTLPVSERNGFVWAAFDPDTTEPQFSASPSKQAIVLRSVAMQGPLERVRAALEHYRYSPKAAETSVPTNSAEVSHLSSYSLRISVLGESGPVDVQFNLLPASAGKTLVHAAVSGDASASEVVRQHHAFLLEDLRRTLAAECSPTVTEQTDQLKPIRFIVPNKQAGSASIICEVLRRWKESDGVMAFELRSISGKLPPMQAGAHINLRTPSGLVRQYSIVNAPTERATLTIGVKLEPDSRGGSASMHASALPGTHLEFVPTRNTFPLLDTPKYPVLIAGGIGITPLVSMAQALHAAGKDFRLHYFVRSDEHVSFASRMAAFQDKLVLHAACTPQETKSILDQVLTQSSQPQIVYACGPGPMLTTIRACTQAAGMPDADVRFEIFRNDKDFGDGKPFTVKLKRNGQTITVPRGETLLAALKRNGIPVEASCEQGICGSCLTRVSSGVPEHRDSYLTPQEKAANTCMMACVSRAISEELELDL